METQTSVRFSQELIDRLDHWCEAQPLKPTRAQAIRSFVEMALTPHELKRVDQGAPDYLNAKHL